MEESFTVELVGNKNGCFYVMSLGGLVGQFADIYGEVDQKGLQLVMNGGSGVCLGCEFGHGACVEFGRDHREGAVIRTAKYVFSQQIYLLEISFLHNLIEYLRNDAVEFVWISSCQGFLNSSENKLLVEGGSQDKLGFIFSDNRDVIGLFELEQKILFWQLLANLCVEGICEAERIEESWLLEREYLILFEGFFDNVNWRKVGEFLTFFCQRIVEFRDEGLFRSARSSKTPVVFNISFHNLLKNLVFLDKFIKQSRRNIN